jgi:hypothetical protein
MPKSAVELTAIEFAKRRLRDLYGKEPEGMPEGHGYDLRCGEHCVEVKGMREATPGFCFFTHGTLRAAQERESFELWLVTNAITNPTLHIVTREELLRTMKLEVHWVLPLGKGRLEKYRVPETG